LVTGIEERDAMIAKMKALVLIAPRSLEVREVVIPELKENEVLVEVAAVGVCGSELGGFLGVNALRKPPLIMGHEAAGRIAATSGGSLADGGRPEVGKKVTFNPLVTCGRCSLCMSGRSSLCPERTLIGAHRPGAFAEFVAVPTAQCWALPEAMSPVAGSLTEPVACAVRALKMAQPDASELVWIIGAGPIGLSCLAVAADSGITRLVISDISPPRLQIAEHWGAMAVVNPSETPLHKLWQEKFGEHPDVVIDAVGSEAVRADAIQAVKPSGRIILLGLHNEESNVPCNQIVRNEISLRGSFGYTQEDFQIALAKLENGVVDVHEDWLELRPLTEGQEVFEELVAGSSQSAKIVFELPVSP